MEFSEFFFPTNSLVIWNWEIPGKFCFSSANLTELAKWFKRNFQSHKINPKKLWWRWLIWKRCLLHPLASSCISRLQKLSTAQYILLSPGVGNCALWIMNLELICSCGLWVEWLETLLWVAGSSFHINERKQWIPAIADYDSKPKPPPPPSSSVAQTPAMPMSCPFTPKVIK